MTREFPILYLARVLIEARTPLSVGTGNADGVFDTSLVRDANDLPAIPATSLAGVLRALYAHTFGQDATHSLFGYSSTSGANNQALAFPSRVVISWGALLDSHGRAADGIIFETERMSTDPLYSIVQRQKDLPVHRNRVRLNHRGTAMDTGKFDLSILPAGHRFAFELRLWAKAEEGEGEWNRLLSLLTHPGFRLGGSTRSGLGAIHCVTQHTERYDLRLPARVHALGLLGSDPSHTHGLTSTPIQKSMATHATWLEGTLTLSARGLWRIGQGDLALGNPSKEPDLLPVTEERVQWENGRGRIHTQRDILIPATSLKGVISHRMSYHARRHAGQWNGAQNPDIPAPEVCALFGELKDAPETRGWAGCLYLDDTYLGSHDEKHISLAHNTIDRFTGGVRNHRLFDEQNLFQGLFTVRLVLDLGRLQKVAAHRQISLHDLQKAFKNALTDLCEGRLALGARSTSGNGFFQGTFEGSLADP